VATYRHTQVGWTIGVATAVGSVATIGVLLWLPEGAMRAPAWTPALLAALLGLALALFGWLTVEVDARAVRLRFGVGVFRRTLPIAELVRCDRLRTRLRWGWGLHWTPAGWLYNVSGRDAVRLELRRERPVVIGSDDADALKTAIDVRIAAHAGRPGAGNEE
jgi:hypothetical protein